MQFAHEPVKLRALTGLRFCAAALIAIHHSRVFGLPLPNFHYDHGVSFFFVLSGFILFYVHPKLGGWHEVRLFIWDRVSRVWPAHIVMLCAAILIFGSAIDTLAFPANLLLIQGWIPIGEYYFSYNAVSWSISTELAFYLCFPFLIHRWKHTFWWKILLAAAIVVATVQLCNILGLGGYQPTGVTAHGLVYISPLGRILEFVTGIGCCSIFLWLRKRMPDNFIVFTVLEIGAVCALYFTMSAQLANYFWANASLAGREWLAHSSSLPSCAIAVVVFAFGLGGLSKVLSMRWMNLLGDISFSLYLTHQVVDGWYLRMFPPASTEPNFFGAIMSTCIALAASFVLWTFVEVPARRIIREAARGKLAFGKLPWKVAS